MTFDWQQLLESSTQYVKGLSILLSPNHRPELLNAWKRIQNCDFSDENTWQ